MVEADLFRAGGGLGVEEDREKVLESGKGSKDCSVKVAKRLC